MAHGPSWSGSGGEEFVMRAMFERHRPTAVSEVEPLFERFSGLTSAPPASQGRAQVGEGAGKFQARLRTFQDVGCLKEEVDLRLT